MRGTGRDGEIGGCRCTSKRLVDGECTVLAEMKVLELELGGPPFAFVGLFGLPLEVRVVTFFLTVHCSKNCNIER